METGRQGTPRLARLGGVSFWNTCREVPIRATPPPSPPPPPKAEPADRFDGQGPSVSCRPAPSRGASSAPARLGRFSVSARSEKAALTGGGSPVCPGSPASIGSRPALRPLPSQPAGLPRRSSEGRSCLGRPGREEQRLVGAAPQLRNSAPRECGRLCALRAVPPRRAPPRPRARLFCLLHCRAPVLGGFRIAVSGLPRSAAALPGFGWTPAFRGGGGEGAAPRLPFKCAVMSRLGWGWGSKPFRLPRPV